MQHDIGWTRLGFELAAILGLVEGLTEFLPVSSTGHLIIVGHLMGFTGAMADTAEVTIQLGAILAIMVYERRKIASLLSQAAIGDSYLPTETCWKWILAKTWMEHRDQTFHRSAPKSVVLGRARDRIYRPL